MAVRDGKVAMQDDKTVIVTWTGLLNGDTGKPVNIARFPDKTIQVTGTFGAGGDVDMQGSNLTTPVWGQLHDAPGGTIISIGDNLPLTIAESPLLIRPDVAGGDGTTDLTVTIVAVVR